jgi:ligand-binding sensor domain-containing protein/signal transduction histidine kinase
MRGFFYFTPSPILSVVIHYDRTMHSQPNRSRVLILIISIIFVIQITVRAQQQQQFRNYNAESGLSQSVVQAIQQDKNGYIWVATEVGLNRFDGYRFLSFFREDGLPGNNIQSLSNDRDGKLWIGTDMGVTSWNGRFFETPARFDTLRTRSVLAIYQDSKKRFWVATDGSGLWLIEPSKVTVFNTTNGLVGNRVRDVIEDSEGRIWVGTRDGISLINTNMEIRTITMKDGLPENRIRSFRFDAEGKLWVGTRGGIAIFKDARLIKTYTMSDGLVNNQIKKIDFDLFGDAWIATEDGFSILRKDGFVNFGLEEGLGSSIFNTVFNDREGNLWLGTYGAGVSRYLGNRFESITNREGLPDNMVTAIRKSGENLWISTYGGGVTRFNNQGHRTWNSKNGLIDDRVFDLHVDKTNRLWVATRNGISIIENNSIRELTTTSGLPFRIIRTITEDPSSGLWFGTDGGGLIYYDNEEFKSITTSNGLINNTIRAVKFAKDGSMWVGTYGGLNHYKDGRHTHYTIEDGMVNNIVLDVLPDDDGSVWAATFEGLSHIKDGVITNYTTEQGLPADVIYLIHKDLYGNIWLGTTRGLVRFRLDLTDSKGLPIFKRYTTDYGLAADELNRGAVFGRGDTLWFGTVGGVSVYFRDRDPQISYQPPVYIEQVRIFDQTIMDPMNLELSFRDNSLWFDYTALSYSAPDKVIFEYRLLPIDKEWIVTDFRSVRYAGLSAGDYIFEVRARSNDGNWSEQPARLRFTIQPPFYSSWWFRSILLFGFIGLMAFLYNYYRVNKQVDLERMRVRIASDLHDDVGASLTEIALQTDFLQAYPIPESIKAPLQQIGETSRKIVTTMDDIVWSIDARNDTVGDLTDRMQDYARTMLTPKGISYSIDFDHLETGHSLPVEVRQNIYLIFKEMVNNAVKHSEASHIDIKLAKHNNVSSMYIKDNGVGLANQVRKTGHGLKNLKLRADRIHAQIEFIDESGFGILLTGKNIF